MDDLSGDTCSSNHHVGTLAHRTITPNGVQVLFAARPHSPSGLCVNFIKDMTALRSYQL